MLVLAHRDELIDQAAEKLAHWNPSLNIGVEAGDRKAAAGMDVVVASVATLGRKFSKRLESYFREWPEAVVVDEAHHAAAASYQAIFARFGLFRPDNRTLLLGVTATPFRADGEDLSETFEQVTFRYDIRQAIGDGWLSDIRGLRLKTQARLDRVKQRGGDFATDELAEAVNTPERNAEIAKCWLEHAIGRPTLAFTVNIAHAQTLAREFCRYGIKAEAIWGDDPERAAKVARFRARETQVLANCALLTEGFDAPQTSCVIMARPTRSQGLYMQCIGRGTRLAAGKPDALIIDVVDNSSKFSLANVSKAMGLPEGLDLKGQFACKTAEVLDEIARQHPGATFAEITDLSQVNAIVERVDLFRVDISPEVRENSNLRWMRMPDGFVLWLPNRECMRIRANLLDHFDCVANGHKFAEAKTLHGAFAQADGWVRRSCPAALAVVSGKSRWLGEPATKKQLAVLSRHMGTIPVDLTKGQASALIGRLAAGSLAGSALGR